MPKRLALALSILFLVPVATGKTITGKLYYEVNEQAIRGAKIYAGYSLDSATSDINGWFKIKVDSMQSEQLTIIAPDCDTFQVIVNNRYHIESKIPLAIIRLPEMKLNANVTYGTMEIMAERRIKDHEPRIKYYRYYGRDCILWQVDFLNNMVYPRLAVEVGLKGKCCMTFIVSEEGVISNIEVSVGRPKLLEEGLLRAFKRCRNFNSEEIKELCTFDGKVYPRQFEICVNYVLNFE